VWSHAFRRDKPSDLPEVDALIQAIADGQTVLTTGLVMQELLQGFAGPKAKAQILERFGALPLLMPDRNDHVEAAELRNRCRRAGVQVSTIDALLACLCIRHELTMLTADGDFHAIADHAPLKVWRPNRAPALPPR
jgi:predicted nucleic acid-binding protein